jgi:hypothetical protein
MSEGNTRKPATVETPNQAELPPPDSYQLTMGESDVPISDDHIQADIEAENSDLGHPDDTRMAEVAGEGDAGEGPLSQTYTGDSDDEYFEVEEIRDCKLGLKVCHLSGCSLYLF